MMLLLLLGLERDKCRVLCVIVPGTEFILSTFATAAAIAVIFDLSKYVNILLDIPVVG